MEADAQVATPPSDETVIDAPQADSASAAPQDTAPPPDTEPAPFDPDALLADLDDAKLDALLKASRLSSRVDHRVNTARNNAVAGEQARQRREIGTRENVVRAIEQVGKGLDPNFSVSSLTAEQQNAIWDVISANQQHEASQFLERYADVVRERYDVPAATREQAVKLLEEGGAESKDQFFFTLQDGAVESGVAKAIADSTIQDLIERAGPNSKLVESLTAFRSAESEAAALESKPTMEAPPDVTGSQVTPGDNPVKAMTDIPLGDWQRMPADKRQEMRQAADEWAATHPEEAAQLAEEARRNGVGA